MLSNKVRGTWDQVRGVSREFWGEMTGDGRQFNAGMRLRKIGKLEAEQNLSQAEAEKLVDKQKQ